ncbi:methyltransferase [Desulfonatronospira sp. MSAO_Bac3]|uniref:class I SAM-dependent methyltransferase n=1 Tax=Desulfonatronospira sp. MSAO_Bac3 TaxID=2293857 RepID=UPI00257E39D6|nr:methyltransferase [Desulfonatronospira sp. MSAO_Bac3]
MQDTDFLQTESMDELLARAREKYEVIFEPVRIKDMTLDILQIADMEAYIDQLAETAGDRLELPFWAKIWPASVILGYYLCSLPADKPLDMLELGAGVGLCGLVAAARGHKVLITDNHPDALLFARINILQNNLQERASVQAVDFTADHLSRSFDSILGAEILYQENIYPYLIRFLDKHLDTSLHGEIILSASNARKSPAFFQKAQENFQISHKTLECRDSSADDYEDQESHKITIYRMKARQR